MFTLKPVLNSGNFVIENADGVPVFHGTFDACVAFLRGQFPQPASDC